MTEVVTIERQLTAAESISERILAAVAVGVLQPGEQLPAERELAEMLGVSRTTIRQALARLAALSIIESRRGRAGGTFVADRGAVDAGTTQRILEPIRREIQSLHDYRALIQELIARTAAVRHDARHDADIKRALAAYTEADDVAASRLADRALHDAIAAAAGNEHLAKLGRELASRVNLGFSSEPYSERLRETARAQHRALVEAVLAGDPELAGRLAGEHFRLTSGRAWGVLRPYGRFQTWLAVSAQSQIWSCVPEPPYPVSSRHLPDCGLYNSPLDSGMNTWAAVSLQV
jgi:GntR family transcriptional repressor for pyruvate dehydrogenase complex